MFLSAASRQAPRQLEPRASRLSSLRQCAGGDCFAVTVPPRGGRTARACRQAPKRSSGRFERCSQCIASNCTRSPARRGHTHAPQQLAKGFLPVRPPPRGPRRPVAHLFASPHHRRVGRRSDVKTVVADLGVGQRLPDPLGVRRAHVDAGVFNGGRIATVRMSRQRPQGLMVTTGAGEQQTTAAKSCTAVMGARADAGRQCPWRTPDMSSLARATST